MDEARVLGAGYLLHGVIGRGASGEVWRGEARSSGETVAVKILHPEHLIDAETITRFINERLVLADLEHPNLVHVSDLVIEGNTVAIVMDFIDGPDLNSYIRSTGPFSEAEAAFLGMQLASGLGVAHEHGVTHCDLKPENILLKLDSQGVPRALIGDFGTARFPRSPSRSEVPGIIGTPAYISPEAVRRQEPTPLSDIYSLGAILYELVAGYPPFKADSAYALFRMHAEDPPSRPTSISDDAWELISELLEKDPRKRPQSTEEVTSSLSVLMVDSGGDISFAGHRDAFAFVSSNGDKDGSFSAAEDDYRRLNRSSSNPTILKALGTGLAEPSMLGPGPTSASSPNRALEVEEPLKNNRPFRTRSRPSRYTAYALVLIIIGSILFVWRPEGRHVISHTPIANFPVSLAVTPEHSILPSGATLVSYLLQISPGSNSASDIYRPEDVAVAPDGSVWTSETSATGVAALGLLEPQQQKVLQFPLPSAQGEIGGIALDIHGNLWFTEPAVGKIGRLTPTGNVRSWFLPPYSGTDPGIKAWGAPSAITVGPDGAVWFTESTNYFDSATRALGIAASRDTSSALNGSGNTGSSGSASASGTNGGASSISSTAGSNQLGQFPQADGIGRIDPTTGMITEIQLPPSLAAPDSIVADQNRLWFVTDTAIGSITPGSGQAGSVQVFPVPANWLLAKDSQSIVAGSDGSLWFASKDIATPTVVNAVKMDPASGSMTTFPTNVIGSQKITDFAASASGPVWFSTLGGNSIGLISNNDSVTQFRIPDQATSATPPLPIGLSADKQNGNVWLAELGTGQLALLSAPGGSGQLTAPT